MTGWQDVRAALDAASARGETIRFWWRDDDAGRSHPALLRLLELADQHDAPLALAVVPLWLEADAQALIAASQQAAVLQHGLAHVDHGLVGEKPIELGGGRPAEAIRADLERGRALLTDAFGASTVAVLVPPWNRIDPAVIQDLPGLGFIGLSAFGRRAAPEAAPGLAHVNAHLDPVDWRGTRLFMGKAAVLGSLLGALDAEEPIGILTHHLVMDEPGWRFLDRLVDLLSAHPAARLCSAWELFEVAP